MRRGNKRDLGQITFATGTPSEVRIVASSRRDETGMYTFIVRVYVMQFSA